MLRYTMGRDPWLDPIYHLQRIQEQVNRAFGGLASPAAAAAEYPAMNVWTGEEGAVLTAEVAGVSPDDIEITVHRNTLTLKGKRTAEEESTRDDTVWHRRERDYGAFSRTITLPFNVDAAKVEASFRNGVVKIALPRPETEKPKRIRIAAS